MTHKQALKAAREKFGDKAFAERKFDHLLQKKQCYVGENHSGFVHAVRGMGDTWEQAVARMKKS
jgi:hypothetical protein